MKIKTYIAGPMRGYDNLNHAAFHKAEKHLESEGIYEVFNPAREDEEIGFTEKQLIAEPDMYLRRAIKRDLNKIVDCDAIYMLNGWEKSTGARLEHQLAIFLNLTILYE